MLRDIYNILLEWKLSPNRRPLLLRGARQTGKTYIVNEFGKQEFPSFIRLNFERNPEYKDFFNTVIPSEIIEKISLFTGKKMLQGKTLLFLDEIQECPQSITSLRYFHEEMPGLHVIGAGSLLEFAMNAEDFKMPVGRVQYLYLYPLSFGEFLDATGFQELRNNLLNIINIEKIPENLHLKLIEMVRKYYLTGGMPAVVKEYTTSGDIFECQKIQRSIIDTFLDDFSKYAKVSRHLLLRKVFQAVPAMVGQKFVFARVDQSIRSKELKNALELLETASIATRVRLTSGAGIPLAAGAHDSIFKVIFLDIGLMHAINGMYPETVMEKNLNSIFKGAAAEQFVGQQLMACQSAYSKSGLFYWGRETRNSMAEIDYLIEKEGEVIPVEVKSGHAGHLKSLALFLDKYKSKTALKISQAPFKEGNPVISLPFYAIESFIKK